MIHAHMNPFPFLFVPSSYDKKPYDIDPEKPPQGSGGRQNRVRPDGWVAYSDLEKPKVLF